MSKMQNEQPVCGLDQEKEGIDRSEAAMVESFSCNKKS
jgi:hypothetical protein